MKQSVFVLIFSCFQHLSPAQGVKIGGAGSAQSHVILELDGGGNKGLPLPRLTLAQMNTMPAPDGMVVYVSDEAALYLRNSATFQKLAVNNGGSYTVIT